MKKSNTIDYYPTKTQKAFEYALAHRRKNDRSGIRIAIDLAELLTTAAIGICSLFCMALVISML